MSERPTSTPETGEAIPEQEEALPRFDLKRDFAHAQGLRAAERPEGYFARHVHMIDKVVNDSDNYLNHGGAGWVYRFNNAGIAVKVVKNRQKSDRAEMYDLGNSPTKEAIIQRSLERINVKNARVPHVFDVIEGEEYAVTLMEQVVGPDLKQIYDGRKPLPENFDIKKVFDELGDLLEQMHDGVAGVAHRDLALRNIMYDIRTERTFLIDFGKAVFLGKRSEKERLQLEDEDWKKWEEEFDRFKARFGQ